MTTTEWVFPVDDDDPELAYATGTKLRNGSTEYFLGAAIHFNNRFVPLLKAFLKTLDDAPEGTRIIECQMCACHVIWVNSELVGIDNSGIECEEHVCTHTCWNPEPREK